jgi:hypothetical protein
VHQLTGWSKDLRVSADGDGDGVVSMVGVAALRMLADRTGLTHAISTILARPGFQPVHDRGRVLTDIACAIAAGGTDIVDIEALRAQEVVFGPVASDTTALRALGEVSERDLHRIDDGRATARAHLWSRLPGGVPASTYAGGLSCGRTIVLRVDGTLTIAHSAKENAEGTYKKTFGFHSLGCWIDNTGELAVLLPRPGSAGANTAADLITVVRAAIAQVPADRRADLLITSDGAGAGHALIDWLSSLNTARRSVQYSIGFDVDDHVRAAANILSDLCWMPCLSNTTGGIVDGLDCAEITDALHQRLTQLGWPASMRLIVRRRSCCRSSSPPCSTPAATSTPRSSPTLPGSAHARSRSNAPTPATACTPASKTAYAPPKTPAWTTSRPSRGPSTPLGAPPSPSPSTCSAGYACTRWPTPAWPPPSRRPCATGCCTYPPG